MDAVQMEAENENADRPLVAPSSGFSRRAKFLIGALAMAAAVAVAVVVVSLTHQPMDSRRPEPAKILIIDDNQARGEGWIEARPGAGPFLTKWYGNAGAQSFHHDGAVNKGKVRAMWTPKIEAGGCYEVYEWHAAPSSGFSAANMPRNVPYWIKHRLGETRVSVDQSRNGGAWNALGAFWFDDASAGHRVRSSNDGTDDCQQPGSCYWVADAVKFEKVDDVRCSRTYETSPEQKWMGMEIGTQAQVPEVETPAPKEEFKCEEHLVVNDDHPSVEGKNWVKGRVGEKPYFDEWFGDLWSKDFHHDNAIMPKGTVSATYKPVLSQPGCYLVQEWHLGGSRWCYNYMPKAVPVKITYAQGEALRYIDQSDKGGQWNDIGMFDFDATARIEISNNNTNNCVYTGHCYTVFDSFRLVHLGDSCETADAELAARKADVACNSYGALQQPMRALDNGRARLAVGTNQHPADSTARLARVDSPKAEDTVRAGEMFQIQWRTEGFPDAHSIKFDLKNGREHITELARARAADGSVSVRMPGNAELSTISSRPHGNKFYIRMELAHEELELNTGFMQDQLVAESPEFSVV
jgi:hypothetical protein